MKKLSVSAKINGVERTLNMVVKHGQDNFFLSLLSRTNRMMNKERMMYTKGLK